MPYLKKRLEQAFSQKIPFTTFLDFNIVSLTSTLAEITFNMTPQLIGNILNGSLHGGVTATVFDSVGGLLAMASVLDKMDLAATEEECLASLKKTSTVSLHVNYLTLGHGHSFKAVASTLHAGNKLFRASMKMYNDADRLIAESTGTYLIG